jgi:hypothetical protein
MFLESATKSHGKEAARRHYFMLLLGQVLRHGPSSVGKHQGLQLEQTSYWQQVKIHRIIEV